jgi:hypothetical protein
MTRLVNGLYRKLAPVEGGRLQLDERVADLGSWTTTLAIVSAMGIPPQSFSPHSLQYLASSSLRRASRYRANFAFAPLPPSHRHYDSSRLASVCRAACQTFGPFLRVRRPALVSQAVFRVVAGYFRQPGRLRIQYDVVADTRAFLPLPGVRGSDGKGTESHISATARDRHSGLLLHSRDSVVITARQESAHRLVSRWNAFSKLLRTSGRQP